ncbi:hypothetical protein OG2516_13946 [Oceanicola granulosus HTCC2516]|uniref:DUF2029 domain-containing protein n=2 Tax=Oceanicola granulosus TaxID=252302 RepID=Q2CA47_OCEGH|nr:hypothetical protein OG2516_13946 [Oceanicola granulosus HTCC2516]
MRTALVMGLIFAAFAAASFAMFAADPSPDLHATWIAGELYAAGQTAQVYAGDAPLFTMRPSAGAEAYLAGIGHEGAAYPYVYPPLWAVVASWIAPHVPFAAAKLAANLVNPLLMAGMVALAARTAPRALPLPLLTLVGCAALLSSLPGAVALEQNQPQILVSFLVVAAIERARAGKPLTAGAALALAAAIKLTPALLCLLWLATGRRREAAAFVVAGGALGLLSIGLAGWPLHAAFLAEIDTIRRTVLSTLFTYGLDPILAHTFFGDALTRISGDGALGWHVHAKPDAWAFASSAALLATLAGLALWMRAQARGSGVDMLAWPVALVLLTLLSPLAWGYHYLAALAFLPHLLVRLGLRGGLIAVIALVQPVSLHALRLFENVPAIPNLPAVAGTLTMLAFAGLCLAAMHRAPTRTGPAPTQAHPA